MDGASVASDVDFEAAGTFGRSNGEGGVDDEEKLHWAAIEKLPTYSRARLGVLNQVLENGEERAVEVDFPRLRSLNRRILIENVMRIVEEDDGRLLRGVRARIDRYGFCFKCFSFEINLVLIKF